MYDQDTTFLAIPGPVAIHPRVYRAMNKPIYGHRTDEFRNIYKDCSEKFGKTIQTTRPIQFHAGSGSLGLHAAITNFITKTDTVVPCVNGKFGERVEQISSRFAGTVDAIRVDWGVAIKPEMVKEALEKNPDTSLVTITHNETSTGVLNPLPEISKIVHDHGALLMADCITSAGGDLVEMDNWGIDIFVSGSQKCYGLPPGLAFISLSKAAEDRVNEKATKQDYYADLVTYTKKMEKWDSPFTPAVGLIYGLQESLNIMLEEGMEQRIQRHRKMGSLYRAGLQALGIDLFAEEGYYSNTVTSAKIPEGADASKFSKEMKNLGILIGGGQNNFKGKIFRFGHMNLVGPRELLMVMASIEIALKKAGATIEMGNGVKKIQEGLLG